MMGSGVLAEFFPPFTSDEGTNHYALCLAGLVNMNTEYDPGHEVFIPTSVTE
jgi:hypothetical protein